MPKPVTAPGDTLVLVGSIGSTTAMWEPLLGPLAERFRVVPVDLRGHGAAPASPPGAPADLAAVAGDVVAAIERLDAGRVHLAGVSLGGLVAQWIAVHRPDLVDRVALVCTAARLPPSSAWQERAATVRAHGMGPVAAATPARWLTPEFAAREPAIAAAVEAMVGSVDAESYAQCCDAIAGADLRPDLPRIAAPTLVVAGRQDVAVPLAAAQELAEGIAGARLVVLDAPHVPTWEAAGPLAAALLAHLVPDDVLAAGFAMRRAVLGDGHVDAAIAATTPFTAAFQDFITRYAWGEVWTRPGLSPRERSIATLVALTTLGAEHELAMHVRGARRNGLSDEEIAEVLLHTAIYAGVPRVNRAIAIARDTLS